MKKLLVSLTCLSMALFGTMSTASAATGINVDEQRFLDYLANGMNLVGTEISWPEGSDEYEMMKLILEDESVDLSATEVDTIKDSVKDVQGYVNSFDPTDPMTAEILQTVIDKATPALSVLGLKASYDPVKDELVIMTNSGEELSKQTGVLGKTAGELPDISGATTAAASGTKLENTGEDFSSTYAIVGGLAMMLVFAGIVSLKKKEAK